MNERLAAAGATPAPRLRPSRTGLGLLVLAVLVAHLFALGLLADVLGSNHGDPPPERIQATYVAELVPTQPPAAAAAAAAPAATGTGGPTVAMLTRPAAAPTPEPAASAPPPVPAQALAPEPARPLAAAAEPAAPAPPQAARPDAASHDPAVAEAPNVLAAAPPGDPVASVPTLPAAPAGEASGEAPVVVRGGSSLTTAEPLPIFEWPPSTRLNYILTGQYRGELHGFAQVEWLRDGDRYQVHLEVIVGLPVAPFLTRRMSSDGSLGPQGLVPERYDEVTRIALRPERAAVVKFDPSGVRLADGQWRPRPPGVQDTASQFVQMAYLFNLDPRRLAPGGTVVLPLALPRRVDAWTYDVLPAESVDTPIGPLSTVPLRPRPLADRRDTLSVDVWVAPSLRFLPVRLRIRQDEETYVDLLLAKPPDVAAR